MRMPRRFLAFLICTLVLMGLAGSRLAAKRGPVRPRSTSAPIARPKSKSTTSKKQARRASAAVRSKFRAKSAKASTSSRPSATSGPRSSSQASLMARRGNTSTNGLKDRCRHWGGYTSRSVGSVKTGVRPSSNVSQLNALRARGLSAPGDYARTAAARVQRNQSPLRRQSESALPHVLQRYAQCFKPGQYTFRRTDQEMTLVRYIGGDSKPKGRWMTTSLTDKPLSPEAAHTTLALPGRPTHYVLVTIPRGTWIMEGPAAPALHQPGGGHQIHVDRLQGLSFSQPIRLD
jgi:hypothetical protein